MLLLLLLLSSPLYYIFICYYYYHLLCIISLYVIIIVITKTDHKSYYVGESARDKAHVSQPYVGGLIKSWEEMEAVWEHCFRSLDIDCAGRGECVKLTVC